MLIKMDMQTLNDDVLRYEPVSPEINEITASAIIWIVICIYYVDGKGVDPDQLASQEASWSESTLFSEVDV